MKTIEEYMIEMEEKFGIITPENWEKAMDWLDEKIEQLQEFKPLPQLRG